MAYKINIRNTANDGWVNLLQGQYCELTDTNNKFTATHLEAAVEELYDDKAPRIEASTDPANTDDSYQIGAVWVNTTSDLAWICVDNTASSAVWLSLSDQEGTTDIVGSMVTGNTETNITVTFQDDDNTLDFEVATADTSTLGVASFDSNDFNVTAGAVELEDTVVKSVTTDSGAMTPSTHGFSVLGGEGMDVTHSGTSITVAGEDATTANKGIASFDSDDFDVASGAVTLEDTVVKGVTTDTGALTVSSHGFSVLGGEGMDVTHSGTTITVAGEDATVSNKGVASFATADFVVGSGAVSLQSDVMRTDGTTAFTAEVTGVDPTSDSSIATKGYVDSVAEGLAVHDPVRLSTTAAMSATYDNGTAGVGATLTNAGVQAALSVDSVAASAGDRIMFKNQTSASQNGIYEVTTVGTGSTNWVVTRSTDFDNSPTKEIHDGDYFFVGEGTINNHAGFVQTEPGVITVGTTDIDFAQFSGAGQIIDGNLLSKSGNTLDVDANVVAGITSDSGAMTITGNAVSVLGGEGMDVTHSGTTITVAGEDSTTANKGIASFESADFGVTAGAVSLGDDVVKDITTDSGALTPTSHGFSILGGEGMDVTHSGATITVAGEVATTANLGVASFDSADFDVTAGAVTLEDTVVKAITTDSGAMTISGHGVSILGDDTTGVDVTHSGTTITIKNELASTSNVGSASFNSADFAVSAGGEVTITNSGVDHDTITNTHNLTTDIDHGNIAAASLLDDDHTQYMHNTSARTVSAVHTFNPSSAGAPFTLGANALSQLVTGLNSEYVQGRRWSVAASASSPGSTSTSDMWVEITA